MECPKCEGSGTVRPWHAPHSGWADCEICAGLWDDECGLCEGTGEVEEDDNGEDPS
jgi:hypothetical protein